MLVTKLFMFDASKISLLKKNIDIEFEDGVIYKNLGYKKVILFRYMLDFYDKIDFPITSDLWIDNNLTKGLFTSGTYLNVYSKIFKTVVDPHIEKYGNNDIMHDLFKAMYKTIEKLNNEFISKIIGFVVSTDILDILEVQYQKELIDALVVSNEKKDKRSVEETYKVLDDIMHSDKLPHSVIKLFYLSGVVSKDQIRQLFGSRGFITEIDSQLFSIPMTNSFTFGFKNVYELAIESRAGGKALYLSGKAIQDSEYMSRELQLVTMLIKTAKLTDCGHPTYVDFYVKPKEYDQDGREIYKGDLINLVGKHYLQDGKELIIKGDERHLEDTFIKMRSAIHCTLPNKHEICSACLGELSKSIFPHQNLGNLCTTSTTSKLSQSLLSAKHLLKSASSTKVKLLESVKKYLIARNDEALFFKANVLGKKIKRVYLKIRQDEAWGLSNVMYTKDILSININKITRLDTITLIFDGGKDRTELELPIKVGNKYAYLTIHALAHIIKNGYDAIDEEHYIIDINDFDNSKPFFKYDNVEFDFSALGKEFKKLLKTRKYKVINGEIRSEYGPDVLVQHLFDLVNNKLSINIMQLEVIVYAFTAQHLDKFDYDLGRNSPNMDLVGFKEAIDFRSLGASMGWDNLQGKVENPMSFISTNKPSHPMDVIFSPAEVVKEYKKQLTK